MKSFSLFIHIYKSGQPQFVYGYGTGDGEFVWMTEGRDDNPDGAIDVYYRDSSEYSEEDLRQAIQNATASANELWHQKLMRIDQPSGRVTLFPRTSWIGHEDEVFTKVLPLIEAKIPKD